MSALKLIIAKEFNERVRKKSFIISTLVTPIFFALIMVAPALLANYGAGENEERWNIMVIDQTDSISSSLKSSELVTYSPKEISEQEGKDEVKTTTNYQALLLISPKSEFSLYIKEQPSAKINDQIRRNVTEIIRQNKITKYNIKDIKDIISDINANVEIKSYKLTEEGEKKISTIVPKAMSFIFGLMIYMFILIYGNQVSMSVITEKSSRVIELIVSQVKPFWLMMGKIIGIGSVGLLQFIIWMVLSFLISAVIKSVFIPDIDMSQIGNTAATGMSEGAAAALATIADPWYIIKVLGCFIIFFLGGYMLYGAMFAAVGSSVDNVQEVAQFTTPITMPLIISVVMLTFIAESPNSTIATILSYIPFTSPVIMMARVPYDSVPWYEIVGSIIVLIASITAITYLAAKIFRVGIFMYGKKVSWKEIMKWAKYN